MEITPLLRNANKICTHFRGYVLGIARGTSTVRFTPLSLAAAQTIFSVILGFCESPAGKHREGAWSLIDVTAVLRLGVRQTAAPPVSSYQNISFEFPNFGRVYFCNKALLKH